LNEVVQNRAGDFTVIKNTQKKYVHYVSGHNPNK